ncbi:MAG: PadR family transcriptional regulator [Candidatus Borkfalkiaceae bacterium]|nr:PadR family transcriptional regulator [Christensenellaceae bacterium]
MENSISSDLIRGHIDTIILNSLLDGDKYPQQIMDYVELKSEKKYSVNQATLYSSLKRLESLKHVNGYWHDSENGRRRFYSITETGKKYVSDNLKNWAYSRAIINTLIDADPEKQVVVIEKPVFSDVKENVESNTSLSTSNSLEKPYSPSSDTVFSLEKKNDVNNNVEENKMDYSVNRASNIEEINFRSILNGLIRYEKQATKTKELKTEKNDVEEPQNASSQVQKLNETIKTKEENFTLNTTPAYEDAVTLAKRDGYKIKIYSKTMKKAKGNVFINKLNFVSSLFLMLLSFIELFIISIVSKDDFTISFPILTGLIVVFAIYPIYCTVKYYGDQSKTCLPIRKDVILNAAIVVFNLILITFALCLILNLNFSSAKDLTLWFIIPCILYLDIVLYYIFKYFISLNKSFLVN